MGIDFDFSEIEKKAQSNESISLEEALKLSDLSEENLKDIITLISIANKVKIKNFGNNFSLCGNVYAFWTRCSEDCAYCLLSGHYPTAMEPTRFKSEEEIVEAAKKRATEGATRFKIITAGLRIDFRKEFEIILRAIRRIKKETNLFVCASLGLLSEEAAKALKEAGLDQYNHNLETSADYFPKICTTHSYADRVNTIKYAKKYGMKVCCGGIIGLGESKEDRIKLAFQLKELDVDSLPFNTFVPWPGTPLENVKPPPPLELIKTLAIFRLILPTKHIVLGAGREHNLRDLQAIALLAGASGMMLPSYLTTKEGGRTAEQDIQMLKDLNFNILQEEYFISELKMK